MLTYFISDLHLSKERPDLTSLFINFLTNEACKADSIYILGDLFELWIGDDYIPVFVKEIIANLNNLSKKNVSLYFLPGNRDFLIGKKFALQTGCQLIQEPKIINIDGENLLIMHGDTLCKDDIAYIKMRKKFRNKILQFLFLMLPLKKRFKIAELIRKKSKASATKKQPEIMDVNQNAVVDIFKKYQVNCLIHGHTHRPNIHRLRINGIDCERIVLGAWEDGAEILKIENRDKKLFPIR